FLERQSETVEADRTATRRFERRRRVNALVVAAALSEEKWQRVARHLRDVQQVILIAHFCELGLLRVGGQAGHVIGILAVDADEILPRLIRERRLREELGPRYASVAAHEAVFAEVLFVEKHRRTEILERVARRELAVARDVDAEILDQPLRGVAVGK